MDNPYRTILAERYLNGDSLTEFDSAPIALLKIAANSYAGGFPGGNPHRFVLCQWDRIVGESHFLEQLRSDWRKHLGEQP